MVTGAQVSRYSLHLLTFADQSPMRAAASRAYLTCSDALPVLVDNFQEFIPDDEERKAFGERAVAEFTGGKFHLTFNMYGIRKFMLISSDTIIARKPRVKVDVGPKKSRRS